MEIGLKSAIIISAVVHAAIAAPLYNHNFFKGNFIKKDLVIVDYIVLKEISNISIANTAKNAAATVEPDKVSVKSDMVQASTQTKPAVKHSRAEYLRRLLDARNRKKNISSSSEKEQAVKEAAKKDAQIRSSRDYQDYYSFLKEKIRDRLQDNYRYYKGEGDVYVSFVLGSRGELISYNIDRLKSAKDEVLLHITGTSLMAVAPFPPLPKSIALPKMSFAITVSFKK
jgi:hypothetical protein